jgi:hypothetical protein
VLELGTREPALGVGMHQREEGVAICAVPGIDKARPNDRRPRDCVAASDHGAVRDLMLATTGGP